MALTRGGCGILFSIILLILDWGITEHISKDAAEFPSPAETAKALSYGLLRIAKQRKGHSLPPRVDLIVILDSSNAVAKRFHTLTSFTNRLIDEFSVSPSTSRVSLVRCSSTAELSIDLGEFVNREGTSKAIANARFKGGKKCDLRHALQLTQRLVARSRHDTRNKAHPVVFAVTASSDCMDSKATSIAKSLRDSGAEMYLLLIGSQKRKSNQKIIPKNLVKTHLLRVRSFSDLTNIPRYFKGKGFHVQCSGSKPVFDECSRRCRCSSTGELVGCYRIRKEFTTMPIPERQRYIQAFKTVSTLAPYKTYYDRLTRYHPHLFEKVHILKYFFPWHRWYILTFENFLRRIDCRVTVPYWQWTEDVTADRLWRSSHYHDVWFPGPHGLGGNGVGKNRCVLDGPFRKGAWELSPWLQQTKCLTREFNDCYKRFLPKRKDVEFLLKMPLGKFEVFEDNVRGFMHNDFHNAIGGVMSLEESASAPEFWFHHCFLDKVWSDWQSRGPKFKFVYYDKVSTKLPGAGVHGSQFVDLSRQPLSVKVVYEQPRFSLRRNDKFYPGVAMAKAIFDCDDSNKKLRNYKSRLREYYDKDEEQDDEHDDDDEDDEEPDEENDDDHNDDHNDDDN